MPSMRLTPVCPCMLVIFSTSEYNNHMLTKIVEKLKTGAIKNVVPYGVASLPAPPYIVVRPEADSLGRGRLMRIFIHMSPGQQIFLEDYAFNTVPGLLDDFDADDRFGNYNEVLPTSDYGDIVTNNDDGTISMERRFLVPQVTF